MAEAGSPNAGSSGLAKLSHITNGGSSSSSSNGHNNSHGGNADAAAGGGNGGGNGGGDASSSSGAALAQIQSAQNSATCSSSLSSSASSSSNGVSSSSSQNGFNGVHLMPAAASQRRSLSACDALRAMNDARLRLSRTPRVRTPGGFLIDRAELTQVLVQSLEDLGYQSTADHLRQSSGFSSERDLWSKFQALVLSAQWRELEMLLDHLEVSEEVARRYRLAIYEQQYLELLERGDQVTGALQFLHESLAPVLLLQEDDNDDALSSTSSSSSSSSSPSPSLSHPRLLSFHAIGDENIPEELEDHDPSFPRTLSQRQARLTYLTSLVSIDSSEKLRAEAQWDGARGSSREVLAQRLRRLLPVNVFMGDRKLLSLLDESIRYQMLKSPWHNSVDPRVSLLTPRPCSQDGLPARTLHVLAHHADEVWCVKFSPSGRMMASASADRTVVIWRFPFPEPAAVPAPAGSPRRKKSSRTRTRTPSSKSALTTSSSPQNGSSDSHAPRGVGDDFRSGAVAAGGVSSASASAAPGPHTHSHSLSSFTSGSLSHDGTAADDSKYHHSSSSSSSSGSKNGTGAAPSTSTSPSNRGGGGGQLNNASLLSSSSSSLAPAADRSSRTASSQRSRSPAASGGDDGSPRSTQRSADVSKRLSDADYLPVASRVLKIGDASAVFQLVWSPDEKYIVCCTETELRAFSVETGDLLFAKKELLEPSCAWYTCSTAILCSSMSSSSLCVLNLNGEVVEQIPCGRRVSRCALSPDCSRIVCTTADKEIWILSVSPLTRENSPRAFGSPGLTLSDRRTLVSTASTSASAFSRERSNDNAMQDDQKQAPPVDPVGAGAGAGSNGGGSSHAQWREFASDKLRIRKIHAEEAISSFTLSEDSAGRYCLLSLQHCGELHLIDLDEPRNFVIKFRGLSQSRYVVQSDFGGVGPVRVFVVSGSEDSRVHIWHRESGQLLKRLAGHSGIVNTVSWSPSHPELLVSGSDDHTIRIWGRDAERLAD